MLPSWLAKRLQERNANRISPVAQEEDIGKAASTSVKETPGMDIPTLSPHWSACLAQIFSPLDISVIKTTSRSCRWMRKALSVSLTKFFRFGLSQRLNCERVLGRYPSPSPSPEHK